MGSTGGAGRGRSLVEASKPEILLAAIRYEVTDAGRKGEDPRLGDLVAVMVLEKVGKRFGSIGELLDFIEESGV